ncbi:hypothetical protein [Mesoplasma photuris]|uniref:hypothetical protein n=1 Tax=Mesoplasma photuris TaxID=217731 RepID=UPI0004E1A2EB|nr:hypothetical protein [Mesoplasma photuris]
MRLDQKLDIMKNQKDGSVNYILSKEFFRQITTGKFLKLNDLCEKVNVSQSAVSKFCIRLGYSGYREFLDNLRMLSDHYVIDMPPLNCTEPSSLHCHTLNTLDTLYEKNELAIKKIANIYKLIGPEDGVRTFIINSPNWQSQSFYLCEIISATGLEVYKNAISQLAYKKYDKIRKNDIVFFLVGDSLNQDVYYFFDEIKAKCDNLIIMTSDKSFKRFDGDFIHIDLDVRSNIPSIVLERLSFEYILTQIWVTIFQDQ